MSDNVPGSNGAIRPHKGPALRFDPVNPAEHLDALLGGLTQEQQNALVADYTAGKIDIAKKGAQMHLDANSFRSMLDMMSETTARIAREEGNSVTMSHTHDTSVGRTEVIMGNTQQAASGKLTRTMAGERNLTLLYVVVGIVAALIFASMLIHH